LDDMLGVASGDYLGLLEQLTRYKTGPLIIRVGAVAAGRMKGVWSNPVLQALDTIHKATGGLCWSVGSGQTTRPD
jgi:hypothetical protein